MMVVMVVAAAAAADTDNDDNDDDDDDDDAGLNHASFGVRINEITRKEITEAVCGIICVWNVMNILWVGMIAYGM